MKRAWSANTGSPGFSARAADEFGDISVAPNAIYTGSTFHGYAEMRVVLENHSHSKTHVVTLVYPNNAYGNYGNNISRLSRTVTLGPDAREVVSLLQPPLPAQGDNSIRVEVDHRHGGEVRAPNANNHCNYNSRGGLAATVLVSRSLDYDAVERVFHANHGAFTAAMAVGPPDASGGGYQPSTWMPDTRHSGQTNWLELDYKPQPVDKISIYKPVSNPLAGEIILTGVSGTNAARMAVGISATVTVIDKSLSRLRELEQQFGTQIHTLFSTAAAIEAAVTEADLVIGAVLVPGAAAPKLVTREMIRRMRPGSVVVDIAIDQGGCCETSRPTTHAQPTYVEEGGVHYCVTNMPGAVARTSTIALGNATLPFVLALADKGWKAAVKADLHLLAGLNVHAGDITCPAVAEALALPCRSSAEIIRG